MFKVKEVNKNIIDKNINLYGKQVIHFYAIEEMAELQKELTKALRCKGDYDNLVEEISDVYYTLSMIRQAYNITEEEINDVIKAKEERARIRMIVEDKNLRGDNK